MNRKFKLVNRLLVLALIYIALNLLQNIDYRQLFLSIIEDHNKLITLVSIIGQVLSIPQPIISFIMLIIVKKLFATDNTRRIYNAMILTTIIIFVVGLIYTLISFNTINNEQNMIPINKIISSILYYIALYIHVPFYIALIIKEGTKFNWMFLGRLASIWTFSIKNIISIIRKQLEVHKIMTAFYFNHTHPGVVFFLHSKLINEANSLLFAFGAIVLAIQLKHRLKQQQPQNEINQ